MCRIIFHDLLKTHGTSYVRRHMLPLYHTTVLSGSGKRDRIVEHLSTRISGNRDGRRLFSAIKDLFLSAIDTLLEETSEKLEAVTDRCCEDIRNDLRLLNEATPVLDQGGFIRTVSNLLERSKLNRNQAQRDFDALFPEPEVPN
jgi:hypothetical protein